MLPIRKLMAMVLQRYKDRSFLECLRRTSWIPANYWEIMYISLFFFSMEAYQFSSEDFSMRAKLLVSLCTHLLWIWHFSQAFLYWELNCDLSD